jgi:AraC-like DNA-binding protein
VSIVYGSVSTLLLRPVFAAMPAEKRERFFTATDLSAEMHADPDARVSAPQFCVAWSELVRATDSHVALRMAESAPVGAFGLVEYVCRSAPTLGDSLRQWVRYLNLLDDAVEVALVAQGDDVAIRVTRESEAPAPASHELCFALLVRHARELSTRNPGVVSVEFAHRTANTGEYGRWFGVPVAFGAEHTQLLFRADALEVPLSSADPNLAAILGPQAEGVANARRAESDARPFSSQVRRHLVVGLRNDDTTIEKIAARMGVTPRTMQRRLKDDATSFNALRENVRQELVSEYLDQDLSIAEISFLLGFSQPSAFFRAFKRWTGLTPQESRAQRTSVAT